MSEIAKLLRFQNYATKEYKITAVSVGDSGQAFTTQLIEGYSRIGFYAYNNSNSASGEVYWGDSNVTPANGFPIPIGAVEEIPIIDELGVYFCSISGELGDLRILEYA